jgi:hypothetical protein
MKRLTAVCILSVLVSACESETVLPRPAPASAGTTLPDVSVRQFTLSGTITNSLGAPIAGAQVEVLTSVYNEQLGANESTYVASTQTDATGRFVLAGLESGTFLIEVSRNGTELVSSYVTVYGDTTWNVTVTQ